MHKLSSLRLITLLGIVTCIISVGYSPVVESPQMQITPEDHLPASQHLILLYAYPWRENADPNLYYANVETGIVSKWDILQSFSPNTVGLVGWSETKQELLMTGTLKGAEPPNQLYAINSDRTFKLASKKSLPVVWASKDKRLIGFKDRFITICYKTGACAPNAAEVSPNGKWLAFSWCPEARSCAIYRTDINGQNLQKLSTEFPYDPFRIQWSPDNSKLAFIEIRGELPSRLWVVNFDGSNAMSLSEIDEDLSWSPDSAKIAFTSEKGGYRYTYIVQGGKHMGDKGTAYTNSIFVIDLSTKEIQRVTYLRDLIITQLLWIR